MSRWDNFRHKDRDAFLVGGGDLSGAIRAYKASSKEQLASLKRRIPKPSERRRLKEQLARKRTTKMRKAVEHLKLKAPPRRPWQSQQSQERRSPEIIRRTVRMVGRI